MRIAVVGCGAMGSIYAALLGSAGNDVIVVDTNVEHVDAIQRQGLRVHGASGDRTVQVPAYVEPPACTVDLVVCAVKARFVAQAAASMHSLLGPETAVLTIQNGLGSAEVVARAVGGERLIVGVAQGFGASLPEPGRAHHNDMKAIRMGGYGAIAGERVRRIAALWAEAGFDAAAVDDIVAMQWEKLICNVAYSAPCALTGMTVGEVREHAQAGAVSRAAAREAFTVARALGVAVRFVDPEAEVREFAARMPNAKPSVLLDLEAGRISEVDVINGAIPTEAEKVGLQAPVNATLTGLVQARESRRADAATGAVGAVHRG